MKDPLKNKIETLLHSHRTISAEEIAHLLNLDRQIVIEKLNLLKQEYDQNATLKLVEARGVWQLSGEGSSGPATDKHFSFKIKIIAFFVIIFLTLLVGELAVRIFAPQMLYTKYNPDHPDYKRAIVYDDYIGWSPVKNYSQRSYSNDYRYSLVDITHNSQGYRMDHEINTSTENIIISGDSFAYGYFVDDQNIVSAHLNKLLRGGGENLK